MDSEAHEDGSSSRNAKRTVYGIRRISGDDAGPAQMRGYRGGTRRNGVELILSDGSSFFIPSRLWAELGRAEGDPADNAWIQRLTTLAQRHGIRDRALGLLARREHSRRQLALKLAQRGYDQQVVDGVLKDLAAQGLLDDRRFAMTWVESRLRRHPEGRAALLAGLGRAGVAREIAESSVDAVLEEDDSLLDTALAAAAEKMQRTRILEPEELTRKLAARGFSFDRIRRYLQRVDDGDI